MPCQHAPLILTPAPPPPLPPLVQVAPVDSVGSSFIPALFGHGQSDTFIKIAHSEALHAAYAGDKNLIRCGKAGRQAENYQAGVGVGRAG